MQSVPAKYYGIKVARALVRGEVEVALTLLQSHNRKWNVSEGKALLGAVRYAKQRHGANLHWKDFFNH